MLAFEGAEKRNAFKWDDKFVASLGEVTTEMLREKLKMLREKLQILGDETRTDTVKIPDAKAWMKELDSLLAKFGIGEFSEAFVIDCDLAKDWRKLFTYWGNEKVQSQRERSVSSARLESSKKA